MIYIFLCYSFFTCFYATHNAKTSIMRNVCAILGKVLGATMQKTVHKSAPLMLFSHVLNCFLPMTSSLMSRVYSQFFWYFSMFVTISFNRGSDLRRPVDSKAWGLKRLTSLTICKCLSPNNAFLPVENRS